MVMEAAPAAILGIRHPSPTLTEVLVQWQDLPCSEATWEDYNKLLAVFPSLHLEDKVKLLAEGIVIPTQPATIMKVYHRRNNK